ncbi:unnamed protein product [Prunus armeniaca]
MVEEYEGEDMTEEVPADPEGGAAEADGGSGVEGGGPGGLRGVRAGQGFRDRGCRSGGGSGLPSVYRVFYLAGQGGRLGNGGPTLPFQAVQPREEAQPQLHCRSPPPLPEGITKEMVEEYEGEDMTEEVPADPEGGAAEADGAAPDADEAAA